MSEDLSAMIRVGVTITLVASLVATVLSLVVVAQSLLGSGVSNLQSGTNQISQQEFEKYNQKNNLTGVEVKTAITLYENRDIAILVKNMKGGGGSVDGDYFNYGALMNVGSVSPTAPYKVSISSSEVATHSANAVDKVKGNSFYTGSLLDGDNNGVVDLNMDKSNITKKTSPEYISDTGRFSAMLIRDDSGEICGIIFYQTK